MSFPPELGALCFQLLNTPNLALPRCLPELLRQVQHCQVPLSSSSENSTKSDAPTAVLVHKLKTLLTSFLNGRVAEQRFTAVVLIKAVVEVGGWEVLRTSEPWVRGLLSVLAKSDCPATKELCIVALCKIYSLTHQYQTLVREITTPTLPTFIMTCLNLVNAKSSFNRPGTPSSLTEIVFRSFANLLPRHTTIYRPYILQIRAVIKPYLAPTLSDRFVPSSLQGSARRLSVLLHLTAAKNAGGEEWGKAVRHIIKETQGTADQVFRAVVEDWESTAGYHGSPVDVSKELSGGGDTVDDFPPWTGIVAGVQRLVGLLGMLEEYIKSETSMPVTIPLGIMVDLTVRMLSIAIPSPSPSVTYETTRLHPAIDRDERDALWSGMPQIYVAAVQLIDAVADRLQGSFVTLAQSFLGQLVWVFFSGKNNPRFRLVTYQVLAKILKLIGRSLGRNQSSQMSIICRSCCHDVYSIQAEDGGSADEKLNANGKRPRSIHDADSLLRTSSKTLAGLSKTHNDTEEAARHLLPLLMSDLPQQHIHLSVRCLLEQTAILACHKDAMLASILNPYVTRNGRTLAAMLTHIATEFPHDPIVEMLLRPRLPRLSSTVAQYANEVGAMDELEDEDIAMDESNANQYENLALVQTTVSTSTYTADERPPASPGATTSQLGLPPATSTTSMASTGIHLIPTGPLPYLPGLENFSSVTQAQPPVDDVSDSDSDAFSIPLVMDMDSDTD